MSLPHAPDLAFPSSLETGPFQVMHLKRYLARLLAASGGTVPVPTAEEVLLDSALLSVLGLGLQPTLVYVYGHRPNVREFAEWVERTVGTPDPQEVERFNRVLTGPHETRSPTKVLSEEDWAFWNQNGYLIIRNAVPKAQCDEVIDALCHFIGIRRDDPSSWSLTHPQQQGIMVQLFQHPVMAKNRASSRIIGVYEELWGQTGLWPTIDRLGFNPPETATFRFQGPRLHWDVLPLCPPMPFGLQGILYLADTAENQGAFTLVPGFHTRIDEWLHQVPPGADPQKEDLYALGPKPIAANAGDFIVWHHCLPHGSSPNTAQLPRFVQYINYLPGRLGE